MIRLLIRKQVNESLLLWSSCAVMLLLFCWMRVWTLSLFDLSQFRPMIEQFRRFEKFAPVPLEQLLTEHGSVALTFNEPILMLCVITWCIARGSDVVSGELNRGTLELMLAQPISRFRYLAVHYFVGLAGLIGLCSVAWIGLSLGLITNKIKQTTVDQVQFQVPFLPLNIPVDVGATTELVPMSTLAPPHMFIWPSVNLAAFGLLVFSFAFCVSCFDRYRWRTIGISIGVYVLQLLLFLLGRATESTAGCGYLTVFSIYQPSGLVQLIHRHPNLVWDIVASNALQETTWNSAVGPLGQQILLVLFSLAFLVIAIRHFAQRDLPAPV